MVDVVLHLVVLRQAEQVAVLHVHQILGLCEDILKASVSKYHSDKIPIENLHIYFSHGFELISNQNKTVNLPSMGGISCKIGGSNFQNEKKYCYWYYWCKK